jgi:hypothetical protein
VNERAERIAKTPPTAEDADADDAKRTRRGTTTSDVAIARGDG